MIYFDTTKTGRPGHRSGLMRVSERLRAQLGKAARPVTWSDWQHGAGVQRDDWWLTSELFCEAERPGLADFLREHLGRWAPAFARMLMTRAGPGLLSAFAALLRTFVEGECARFGVVAGADHLVVRQADEEAERLCEGCGLQKGPPGADAET